MHIDFTRTEQNDAGWGFAAFDKAGAQGGIGGDARSTAQAQSLRHARDQEKQRRFWVFDNIPQRIQPVIAAPIRQRHITIIQTHDETGGIAPGRGMGAIAAAGRQYAKGAGGDESTCGGIQAWGDLLQHQVAWRFIMLRQGFQAGDGKRVWGRGLGHGAILPWALAWRHPSQRI